MFQSQQGEWAVDPCEPANGKTDTKGENLMAEGTPREAPVSMPTNKSITMAEAERLYRKYGKIVYADDMDLVRRYRKAGWTHSIPNDSYVHALFLTDLMFGETWKELMMVSGSYAGSFLRRLFATFNGTLDRIKRAGGRARVILLDSTLPQEISELQEEFKGILEIICARVKPGARMTHFIVCDGVMVRDEALHPPLTDRSLVTLVRANVYLNNEKRAEAKALEFEGMWDYLASQA